MPESRRTEALDIGFRRCDSLFGASLAPMQLRPEQLAAHLAKPLAPLYLLHGDEPLLVIEAGDAIRTAARKQGFEEREVIVAGTGFKWDELFLATGNMSLFGGSKLVDLRIPSGKPGREGREALQR